MNFVSIADDVSSAKTIIARAEADLGTLSRGQRRDLLADNTSWSFEKVERIEELVHGRNE